MTYPGGPDNTQPVAGQPSSDPWAQPPWPEIVRLLQQRQKIHAIKYLREFSGMGLADAKKTVEEVERRIAGY